MIEVIDYDSSWHAAFAAEKIHLQEAIGSNAVSVEHIGSTAVVGLAAKPIIDILIAVTSLSELDRANDVIAALGYAVKGENGITGRRYFQKGTNQRSHHVHAFKVDDIHLHRHRVFKDYLIAHNEIALAYGLIKKSAAAKSNNDVNVYMAFKNSFIQKHQQLALEWFDCL